MLDKLQDIWRVMNLLLKIELVRWARQKIQQSFSGIPTTKQWNSFVLISILSCQKICLIVIWHRDSDFWVLQLLSELKIRINENPMSHCDWLVKFHLNTISDSGSCLWLLPAATWSAQIICVAPPFFCCKMNICASIRLHTLVDNFCALDHDTEQIL